MSGDQRSSDIKLEENSIDGMANDADIAEILKAILEAQREILAALLAIQSDTTRASRNLFEGLPW